LIGAYKVAKALLLLAVGLGIFRLLRSDVGEGLERWVTALGLDPDHRYIHSLIERISGVDPRWLKAIGFGTFAYSVLNAVEGVGLWLGLRWAEYLTVIATAALLPFEGFEIVRKPTGIKVLVLLANVGIVAYLIYRLRHDRPARPSEPR
jgi:uncharacterized membrane protein (DUF2068 family)